MSGPHPYILNKEFSSLEEYCYAAKRWKLDFKKISGGKFSAKLKLLDYGIIQIAETRIKGVIVQGADCPENYRSIVIPGDELQSFFWQNYSISSDSLLVWPKNDSIVAVSKSNFHVYVISIHEEFFEELIKEKQLRTVYKKLNSNGFVYPIKRNFLLLINTFLASLFEDYFRNENRILESHHNYHTNKLPEILLDYIDKNDPAMMMKNPSKQVSAVIEFLNYYNTTAIPDTGVAEFCKMHQVKQKTLELGIQEYFQASPVAVIRALKLNKARKLFLQGPDTISQVAKACGFNHMGQFSKDYQKLFMELPSETVNGIFEVSKSFQT